MDRANAMKGGSPKFISGHMPAELKARIMHQPHRSLGPNFLSQNNGYSHFNQGF